MRSDAKVADYQQPHKVTAAVQEARLSHGSVVRADITGVTINDLGSGIPQPFFCHINDLKIRAVIQEGDGKDPVTGVTLDKRLIAALPNQFTTKVGLNDLIVELNSATHIWVDEFSTIAVGGEEKFVLQR